jgi:hypothetical protein
LEAKEIEFSDATWEKEALTKVLILKKEERMPVGPEAKKS